MKKLLFSIMILTTIFSANLFADLKLIEPVSSGYYNTTFHAEFVPIPCEYSLNTIEVFGIKQKAYRNARRLKNVISINHSFPANISYDIDRQQQFIWKNKETAILNIPKNGILIIHYSVSLPSGELINVSEKVSWFPKTKYRKTIQFPRKIPRACHQNSYRKYLNRDDFLQRGSNFFRDKWNSQRGQEVRYRTKEILEKGKNFVEKKWREHHRREGLQ